MASAEIDNSEASTPQFVKILDILPIGVQIIDFNWRYVYLNEAVSLHGKSNRSQMLGHTIMEKYPGIQDTGYFKVLRECMTDRKPKELKKEFEFPDKSRRQFELSIRPVPEGVLVLSTDVTDSVINGNALSFQDKEKEKRANELIIANKELAFQNAEKEKRAQELIIANKELAFQNGEKEKRAEELIIANKELAFQNEEKEQRAKELIIANKELAFQNEEKGKRSAELSIANKELAFQNEEKGKRSAELSIANKELAFQNEEKGKRAAELTIANKELAFQNEEKGKRAAELTVSNKELAFQNEEKEKRAEELYISNHELKKAEEKIRMLNDGLEQKVNERTLELESVNKELESFSYSVSHDLRAPLRAIHGYSRMLMEDHGKQLNPEAGRLIHTIMNNARKMGQLIDDLLTFSRLGRKGFVKSNISIQNMVTQLCKEMKGENPNRNIQFVIGELDPVFGDSAMLQQVWVNLISNAVKYTQLKEEAIIQIGSEIKGSEVIYHIKDNGAGFDMRYAGKLFGVFQRLHTDEKFEGTGVGLAIVHRIILKHGGAIWAEAIANEGAKFSFSMPLK